MTRHAHATVGLPWWARRPDLLLLAVTVAWIGYRHAGPAADWPYFREGSDLILGRHTQLISPAVLGTHPSTLPGGLHLYANYPEMQFGPLTLFLIAAVRAVSGPYGRVVTITLGTLLCVPAVWLVQSAAARWRPEALGVQQRAVLTLVGGCSVLAVWTQATLRYGHVDDALVLFFSALAVWAVVRGDGLVLGIALALAVAAKPTGLVLLPLLLVVTGRQRIIALAVTGVGILVAWLPYVLADPQTLHAGSPVIETAQATALHVLGLHGYLGWVRPVQLGLSLAVGVIAVLRGRWTAAVLAGSAGRLLLEPGAASYYTAGIVLGALIWEAFSAPRPRGLVTAAACAVVYLVPFQAVYSLLPYRPLLTGPLDGWIRLVSCTAVLLAVVLVPRRVGSRVVPPPVGSRSYEPAAAGDVAGTGSPWTSWR